MAVAPPPGPPPAVTANAAQATVAAALQALGEVVVEQVPERLALLARTILITGMVTEQQPGGALVLRTQVGEITIRSQTPLPLDKLLTLQIPPGAPPVRAVVSVAMTPAAAPTVAAPTISPTASPVAAPQPAPIAAPAPAVQTPVMPVLPTLSAPLPPMQIVPEGSLLPGMVIAAQVLELPALKLNIQEKSAPLPLPPAVAAMAELQRTGTAALKALMPKNLAEIVARMPPGVLLPPAPVQPGAPEMASPPPLPAQPAFGSLPVLLTLPAGARATIQVENIGIQKLADGPQTPRNDVQMPRESVQKAPIRASDGPPPPLAFSTPTEVPEAAPTRPLPVTFPAVVIGQTPQREPIVTSPAGLLVLEGRSPLPAGQELELSLVHVSEPMPEEAPVLPSRPHDWPALQQAAALLASLAPHLPALHSVKPEAPGNGLLFFMAALRLASPRAVIPEESARVLQQAGHTEVLTRVQTEVQQLSQSWNKPEVAPQEWRSLTLPLPVQEQMTRLAVHTRQEQEDCGGVEGVRPLRHIVVEVELSRLGPLLLDGYLRPKQFDLTLRSQRRLPKGLPDELRAHWHDVLSALGWHGSLSFQTAAELWLGVG